MHYLKFKNVNADIVLHMCSVHCQLSNSFFSTVGKFTITFIWKTVLIKVNVLIYKVLY